MHMNKCLALVVLLAMSAPAWADRDSYGLYMGGGVGEASYSGTPALSQPGATSGSFGSKPGETLFLGFFVGKDVALESTLFYAGEATAKISGSSINQQVTLGVYGATEDLLGYYRFNDRFSAFGRAGLSAVWTQGNPTVQSSLNGDFGIGLELQSSDAWAFRVGYTHYHHVGVSFGGVDTSNTSVNLANVSVVYWF